jgi:hypothetical protein
VSQRLSVALACTLALVAGTIVGPVATAHADTWTVTGSMAEPQRDLQATLLGNGKVLIVGFSIPELYDPLTGTFGATGTASVSAAHGPLHTATLLADGRVLIVGGALRPLGAAASAAAHIYDPVTDQFSATGSLHVGRAAHTATRLPDGRVLVAGGHTDRVGTTTESAEVYDPATGTFVLTSSLNTARGSAVAALLDDGRVLIVGGTRAHECLASAELYDPGPGVFSTTGSMSVCRVSLWWTQPPVLADGRVLVTGGLTDVAELYDPVAQTFTVAGRMTTLRSTHTATRLSSGHVLLAGGFVAIGPQTRSFAELYDPVSGTFTATASMNVARQQHVATLLPDGRVLVAGGFNGSADVSSAEIFCHQASVVGCPPAPPTPPTADAGMDQIVDEGATVTLHGSGSRDPHGRPLTFRWTQIAGPVVSLSGSGESLPSFLAPFVDTLTILRFQLVVNNGVSDSLPDLVDIIVRGRRPVADAGPDQRVNEAGVVMLDGTRSRTPDGGPLTFRWRQLGGPPVPLVDATTSRPRFRAPPVSADTLMTFELVTSRNGAAGIADVVNVTVQNLGPSLYGTLTVGGRPVSGSEVRLFRSRPLFRTTQLVLRTTTDATGFYAFTRLQPGAYWLQLGGVLHSVSLAAGQDRAVNVGPPPPQFLAPLFRFLPAVGRR